VEHLKQALPISARVEEFGLAHHFFYKGKSCKGSAWCAHNTPEKRANCNLSVAVTVTSPVTAYHLQKFRSDHSIDIGSEL
jgi:hypothetical protein